MDKEFEEGNYEESDEEKYVISDEDDLPHKCGICRKQVICEKAEQDMKRNNRKDLQMLPLQRARSRENKERSERSCRL